MAGLPLMDGSLREPSVLLVRRGAGDCRGQVTNSIRALSVTIDTGWWLDGIGRRSLEGKRAGHSYSHLVSSSCRKTRNAARRAPTRKSGASHMSPSPHLPIDSYPSSPHFMIAIRIRKHGLASHRLTSRAAYPICGSEIPHLQHHRHISSVENLQSAWGTCGMRIGASAAPKAITGQTVRPSQQWLRGWIPRALSDRSGAASL